VAGHGQKLGKALVADRLETGQHLDALPQRIYLGSNGSKRAPAVVESAARRPGNFVAAQPSRLDKRLGGWGS